MGRNYQSISLLSYSILLDEFNAKTFEELYPSFAYDPFAQAYLNEVNDPIINPDNIIDDDVLLDDIVSIMSRDAAVMRSILAYANIPRPSKRLKFRETYILGRHLLSYGIQFWVNALNLFVKRSLESVWITLLVSRVNFFGWIFVFLFLFSKRL